MILGDPIKSIVTGGAGFIGSHLVEALLADDVTVIDDLSTGRNINEKSNFVKKSILDPLSFGDAEVVFHLAAQVSVPLSFEKPELTRRINVDGTKNVLDAALKSDVKKVIFASSAAVYGDVDHPVKETEPVNPQDPYGQSKADAEKLMQKYNEENGIGTVSLRFFNVYGKRMNAGVIKAFIENTKPVITGNGKQTRDFIYVKDVVEANLLAANSKASGEFNVATGTTTTLLSLIEVLEKTTKNKYEPSFAPQRKNDILYSCANIEKASKVLRFTAKTALEEGLRSTIEGQ